MLARVKLHAHEPWCQHYRLFTPPIHERDPVRVVGHLKQEVPGLLNLDSGVVVLAMSLFVCDESGVYLFRIRKTLTVTETRKSRACFTVPVQQDVIHLENPIAAQPCIADI